MPRFHCCYSLHLRAIVKGLFLATIEGYCGGCKWGQSQQLRAPGKSWVRCLPIRPALLLLSLRKSRDSHSIPHPNPNNCAS